MVQERSDYVVKEELLSPSKLPKFGSHKWQIYKPLYS